MSRIPLSVKIIALRFFLAIPLGLLGIICSPGLALFVIPKDLIPIYLELLRFWIISFKHRPELVVFLLQFYVIFVIFYGAIGYGLLRLRNWARVSAIILAFLGLSSFPFGTIIGAFMIGCLFSHEVSQAFNKTGLWPIQKMKMPFIILVMVSVASIAGLLLFPPVERFVTERAALILPVYSELGEAYQQETANFNDPDIYELAIQLNPDSAYGYYNRANIAYRKGDYNQAIADYSQVIRLEPDNVFAYQGRGDAFYTQGDYPHALADYNQVIRLNPAVAQAYVYRANISYGQGDYDQAIADYNQAIQLDPDLSEAYHGRGTAYYVKGEYERAITDYNRAILLKPDDPIVYYNRGLLYGFRGDKEKAIADFEKVLSLSSDPYLQANTEKQLQMLK